MTTCDMEYIIVDYDNIEIVAKSIFVGPITNNGITDKELRRRLAMGKCAMGSLKGILKDRGISLMTNIMIVQTLVFPIILYRAETWTIKKVDRGKNYDFELWCWKLLGVIYLDRRRNTEIIDIIKHKSILLDSIRFERIHSNLELSSMHYHFSDVME